LLLVPLLATVAWGQDSAASAPNSGQKWAVPIGVDEYLHCQSLRYAGADMRAMRDRLVATGFPGKQVFLLDDKAEKTKYRPFKPNIDRELEQVLGMVERDDLIVVAFSGHGVHLDGKSYLCPTEAQLTDGKTLVSLDRVYDRLQKCPASLKLLLVDACRNDPRREGEKGVLPNAGTREFAESLERPPKGILLLTSCAPGQISMEEQDFGQGVFMHFVLEGIGGKAADQDGSVSLMGLFKYANKQTKLYVHDKFNENQTPALKGDIHDDFELARVDYRPPVPRPSPGNEKTITNSIGMKLVLIPAGEFMMGSGESAEATAAYFNANYSMELKPEYLNDEHPAHRVRITRPFYMGAYAVTLGQFLTFYHEAHYKTEGERDGKGCTAATTRGTATISLFWTTTSDASLKSATRSRTFFSACGYGCIRGSGRSAGWKTGFGSSGTACGRTTGGCPRGDGTGNPGYSIACECYQPNHRRHFRGSLSMAHAGRDTGGSQFFLSFAPTRGLDGKHTVFGRVIQGLDVLGKLQRRDPEDPDALEPDKIPQAKVLRKRNHPYVPATLPLRPPMGPGR
jgi:hypothetical protein